MVSEMLNLDSTHILVKIVVANILRGDIILCRVVFLKLKHFPLVTHFFFINHLIYRLSTVIDNGVFVADY